MSNQEKLLRHPDEMLHLTLMGGQARVLMCSTGRLTQLAANIHNTTPVCTVALGRLMAGALMMGEMMKGLDESVTVTVKGDGPIGTMVAVSRPGRVKATLDNPRVTMEPLPDGRLDVGAAVGRVGRMSVVKDLGLKEPYTGQIALVSGEIAEDFAMYFTVSEQQPSLVALGVLTAGEEAVLQAGGVLVQPMPGCKEELLAALELRSPMFASISQELAHVPLDTLVEDWFQGLEPLIVDRSPLAFQCDCSQDRMERALIALGRRELSQLIEEDEGAELTCHFCHNRYGFTTAELRDLLDKATRD